MCTKNCITLLFIIVTVLTVLIFIGDLIVTNSTGTFISDIEQTIEAQRNKGSSVSSVKVNNNKRRNSNQLEFSSSLSNRVRLFVLFIGHTHSSHSFVASVLDSHPHMIVSHESGIIPALVHRATSATYTKDYVFNSIWNSSCKSAHDGNRGKGAKGYNLTLDKEWQGSYDMYVDVFGDDEAQVIPNALIRHEERVQDMLKRLPLLVGVPVKIFHVIRNPYDNIATDVLYRTYNRNRLQIYKAKNSNEKVLVNPEVVEASLRHYFDLYKGIEHVKTNYKLDIMTIHIKDFISQPKSTIIEICKFLRVTCSNDYIDKCSKQIFNKESKTRYRISWQNQQIAYIRSTIEKFHSLKRYEDFDS